MYNSAASPHAVMEGEDGVHEHDPLLATLKAVWGFDSFRAHQREIIQAVLSGRDVFACMATSAGKSLCYQLPGVMSGKMAIVVSPLVSLMQDQVKRLTNLGINAVSLEAGAAAADFDSAFAGDVCMAYVTPERVCVCLEQLRRLAAQDRLALFAIDEAHCVSTWGHDFRASYLQMSQLREHIPGVPIIAVTATATQRVRLDILSQLRLEQPLVVVSSFDRPNLWYAVRQRGRSDERTLMSLLSQPDHKGRCTIVYCRTVEDCSRLARALAAQGFKAAAYHAQLPPHLRKETHERFVCNELSVVCATVAFGMGIDKPDVRCVIHWGAPSSLEAYYQESGRAGRDGKPSRCILYWCPQDLQRNTYFAAKDESQSAAQGADYVADYIHSTSCRRKLLLSFFGEACDTCGSGCDNCDSNLATVDVTKDALLALETINLAPRGTAWVANVLCGQRKSKLGRFATWGKGRHHKLSWWKRFIPSVLMDKNLVTTNAVGKFGAVINVITPEGRGVLWARKQGDTSWRLSAVLPAALQPSTGTSSSSQPKLCTTRSGTLTAAPSPARTPEETTSHALMAALFLKRSELAASTKLPAFKLCSEKALQDIARVRPTTVATLQRLTTITVDQVQRCGAAMCDFVRDWCARQGASSNRVTELKPLPATVAKTVQAYARGMSVDEVARERTLKTTTIQSHLLRAVTEHGCQLDLKRSGLQASDDAKAKLDVAVARPWSNLTELFQAMGGTVSYDQLRLYLYQRKQRGTTDAAASPASATSAGKASPGSRDGAPTGAASPTRIGEGNGDTATGAPVAAAAATGITPATSPTPAPTSSPVARSKLVCASPVSSPFRRTRSPAATLTSLPIPTRTSPAPKESASSGGGGGGGGIVSPVPLPVKHMRRVPSRRRGRGGGPKLTPMEDPPTAVSPVSRAPLKRSRVEVTPTTTSTTSTSTSTSSAAFVADDLDQLMLMAAQRYDQPHTRQ